ncbi:hypothetical protein BJ508DRAFT_49908 [Ascobolus immersus RN42]|uniref:DUF676 domain-containing protein n=1 Tax=Ascobolus immersus RN42 TaxID=1160509 RepID=A0A3N4HH87_ASCIM|nr:hypothetical protein BJ508DRAFT_49908 [Ascobolus immersus RN42]
MRFRSILCRGFWNRQRNPANDTSSEDFREIGDGSSTTATVTEALEKNKDQRKKGGLGLLELHKPSEGSPNDISADIVFVHGLTGGRESTWSRPQSEPWPKTLLAKSLPNCRISTFGYDAEVVNICKMASQCNVRDHARKLVQALTVLREEEPNNRAPIIFIAHSLGGLICEDAIVLLQKDSLAAPTSTSSRLWMGHLSMMLLGVPHGGTALATRAESLTVLFPRPANKNLLHVLKKDNELLSRIQEDCHAAINSRPMLGLSPIHVKCFFEELPTRELNSRQIVPRSSAQFSPAHPPLAIYANHADMGKFEDANNETYKTIVTYLKRWIREAAGPNEQ